MGTFWKWQSGVCDVGYLLVLCFKLFSFLQEDEHDMEVDTAPSGTPAPVKNPLPELEIYCYLLVLIFLIDQKKYNEVE